MTQDIARAWADAGIISHARYVALCAEHGWGFDLARRERLA